MLAPAGVTCSIIMIGLTYQTGLSSIWLMIGWIAGDLMASLLAVGKIGQVARSPRIHSFGGLIYSVAPGVVAGLMIFLLGREIDRMVQHD